MLHCPYPETKGPNMVAATRPKRFSSLGRLAEVFQRSPASLRDFLDAMEIGPSLELNDTPYYRDEDIDRVMRRLRERAVTATIRPADQPHKPANTLR